MRKSLIITLLLCALGNCYFFSSIPAHATPPKMIAQTYYAPNMAVAYDSFIDNINNKLTRLNISKFYGNQIVSSANLLDAVEKGLVYIGHIVPHMYGKIHNGNIITTMPFITNNVTNAEKLFFQSHYYQYAEQELNKYGLKLLGITWGSPYHLLTKKKINSLDELAGLKIRAIGSVAQILSTFGAVCFSTAPENLYLALQDGTLDGVVLGSAYEYKQAKLYEVAPWYNLTALADPIVDYFVMSNTNWNKLLPKEQQIILDEAQKVRSLWYNEVVKTEKELQHTIFKNKTYSFSKTDKEKLNFASKAYLNEKLAQDIQLKEAIKILVNFTNQK